MKKYDVVAFDLDGTLTDPAGGLVQGYIYAFRKLNIDYKSLGDLTRYIGPPLYDEWMRDFSFTPEQADEAIRIFREYYNVYGWWDNKVYPGIEEMLKELKRAGKTIILATSKPEDTAKRVLSLFGLDKYFDYIGGADGHKKRDKKHEVLAYSLESVNAHDLSRAIMIGDRRYDAEGAGIVGIDSMAAQWGHGSEEELRAAGFNYFAKTPLDVVKLLA